jgi:hypothetical protein
MSCRKYLCVYERAPNSEYCGRHQCVAGTCKSGPGRLCPKHRAPGLSPEHKDSRYHCAVSECYNPAIVRVGDVPHCKIHWCWVCCTRSYWCKKHQYDTFPELDGWVTTCNKSDCNNPRYHTGYGQAYFNSCRPCLVFCEAVNCRNLHIKGTKFCQAHACKCYGGDHLKPSCSHNSNAIAYAKNFWWCQSLHCTVCPVSDRFVTLYCMAGLGCDTPIMEALFHSLRRNEIRNQARNIW